VLKEENVCTTPPTKMKRMSLKKHSFTITPRICNTIGRMMEVGAFASRVHNATVCGFLPIVFGEPHAIMFGKPDAMNPLGKTTPPT
jgi:hypothetical protein